MSNTYPTSAPEAKERAAEVKDTSVAAGQHVAGVAKDELHKVGSETKQQAKDLYRQTQGELKDQAASQQKRVASGIRSLSDEFGSMSEKSETQGVASDLAQQAATRAAGIADWLDQREPADLLNEVKGFARRRPGMFIAIAAVAGVVAGRLTRSVIAEAKESSDSDSTASGTAAGVHSQTGTDYGVGTTDDYGTEYGLGNTTGTPAGAGAPLAAEYNEYQGKRDDE
ncbi:hypothetical protein [Cryobacterium sp. AP23]